MSNQADKADKETIGILESWEKKDLAENNSNLFLPIPLYKCPNCEGIYQEKVTECDCSSGPPKWIEGYAIFPR